MYELKQIDSKSKFLKKVQELADSCSSTVGFLPQDVYYDYAKKGHIVVLLDDDKFVGHILYRFKDSVLVIVQVCVSVEYRRSGIAKRMIDMLFDREKENISSMQLSCRRDYNIDGFWKALGFTPISERPGRALKKHTTLTTWVRYNENYINIFSLSNKKSLAKVVVDTNIVISLCDKDNKETLQLEQSYLNDYIDWFISPEVFSEMNRKDEQSVREKHKEYARNNFEIIKCDRKRYEIKLSDILKEEKILSKNIEENSNSYYDMSHIAYALCCGSKYYVTNDSEWLHNEISDMFYDKYGLNILTPSELVKHVDEITSPQNYSPLSLVGLNLKYSEMPHDDFKVVLNSLYKYYADGKKKTFRNALYSWMSDPHKYHLLLVKSNGIPVCLIVYSVQLQNEEVISILIDKKQIKNSRSETFIKCIAFRLLSDCQKNHIKKIEVLKNGIGVNIKQGFEECGYIDCGTHLQRFLCIGTFEPEEINTIAELPQNSTLNNAIQNYKDDSSTRTALASINLEKALWPLKIKSSKVNCYIVPIKAVYAEQLFDENLSNENLSLFSNDKFEPALSIEKVYYKSPKNAVPIFPARILWYISTDSGRMGTGCIRACSYLESVEVSEMKVIFNKYRRLGVFDWNDVKRISDKNGKIAAYNFSFTELFDNNISLDDVQEILGKKTTMQSYVKIDQDAFFEIYKKGRSS